MTYRRAILRQAHDRPGGSPIFPVAGDDVPFSLPCAEQTDGSIARWLTQEAAPGMVVVVRHANWQLYEYHLDQIVRLNSQTGRVQLAQHGSFDSNGSAVSAPKHVLRLLEPRTAVLRAAVAGRTWQHGRPAFKRPLASCEMRLLDLLHAEAGTPPTAEAV